LIRESGMRLASFSLRFCGWFTEGFDTLDLKEAKALLDELASWLSTPSTRTL
jgi:hypothetical protein